MSILDISKPGKEEEEENEKDYFNFINLILEREKKKYLNI